MSNRDLRARERELDEREAAKAQKLDLDRKSGPENGIAKYRQTITL